MRALNHDNNTALYYKATTGIQFHLPECFCKHFAGSGEDFGCVLWSYLKVTTDLVTATCINERNERE